MMSSGLYLIRATAEATTTAPSFRTDLTFHLCPFSIDQSGEASHIYRILLEARVFHEAANRNRVYLITGLGYIIL